MYRFTLIRKGNTIPLYTEEVISLIVDSHTANQILMSHIFFKNTILPNHKVTIRDIDEENQNENDYHIYIKDHDCIEYYFYRYYLDETRTVV